MSRFIKNSFSRTENRTITIKFHEYIFKQKSFTEMPSEHILYFCTTTVYTDSTTQFIKLKSECVNDRHVKHDGRMVCYRNRCYSCHHFSLTAIYQLRQVDIAFDIVSSTLEKKPQSAPLQSPTKTAKIVNLTAHSGFYSAILKIMCRFFIESATCV